MNRRSMCHAAFTILWPPGDAQNAVKHAAATILLWQPDHECDIGRLGNMLSQNLKVKSVKKMLKAAGYDSKIKELLLADPAFTLCRWNTVCLDVPYVLAYADMSGNQPPPAIMPSMAPAAPFFAPPAVPPIGMGMGMGMSAGPAFAPAAAGMWQPANSLQEDRNPDNPQEELVQEVLMLQEESRQQHQHQHQLEQQQQLMHAGHAAAAAAAAQGPAPFPEVFQMHPQQEEDGSYTMYLSELSEQEGSGDAIGGAGSNGSSGSRRKVRAVRGRRGAQGSVSMEEEDSADDLNSLLELLPPNKRLLQELAPYTQPGSQPFLVDLAADLGRPISLRLSDKSCVELPLTLDLDEALARLQEAVTGYMQPSSAAAKRTTRGTARRGANQSAGAGGNNGSGITNSPGGRRCSFFSDTNRLGVPGSLHRISAMRDRAGAVYGLTYRVGRHVPGVADLLADVLSGMRDAARGLDSGSGSSLVPSIASQPSKGLLLLGRPGVGKTTLLRDVARLMSLPESQGDIGMSVVIVDTSNGIAGDCEQPHPCIGNARRMMVPRRHQQAAVMIEAVMNHTPEVIIVDEIATKEEAAACRTIAARGVLLVSTAHGSSLGDLLRNPDLQGLVGGVKAVTLGDKLASADNRGQKTRLERGGAVTFGSLVEILGTSGGCMQTWLPAWIAYCHTATPAAAAARRTWTWPHTHHQVLIPSCAAGRQLPQQQVPSCWSALSLDGYLPQQLGWVARSPLQSGQHHRHTAA